MAIRSETSVEPFITRWQSASGSERANYQLFVHELCALLDLPTPDPAREDTRDVAERLAEVARVLEAAG